jgi:hypothetical protein
MRTEVMFLFFVALTVVPFSATAVADDLFDLWTAPYENRAEIRFEGTVKGVGIEPTRFGYWTYLTVAREDGWFKVYLGPRDFTLRHPLISLLEEKAVITGTLFDEGRRIMIARVLRIGDAVIILRNRDGTPRWDKPGPVEMDPIGRPPAIEAHLRGM